MQSDLQQKPYRWDETLNTTPTNIWAILLVVCRLLPPNHLIPTEKLLLLVLSRWDVVCLFIHWVVPFLLLAGSVYTLRFCSFLLFLLGWEKSSPRSKRICWYKNCNNSNGSANIGYKGQTPQTTKVELPAAKGCTGWSWWGCEVVWEVVNARGLCPTKGALPNVDLCHLGLDCSQQNHQTKSWRLKHQQYHKQMSRASR
jgi:hypothetical protein